jgi:hypothetical protein
LQTGCNRFSSVFENFSNELTGNRTTLKSDQPQPTVRLSSVSVFFPVLATGPSNTSRNAGFLETFTIKQTLIGEIKDRAQNELEGHTGETDSEASE